MKGGYVKNMEAVYVLGGVKMRRDLYNGYGNRQPLFFFYFKLQVISTLWGRATAPNQSWSDYNFEGTCDDRKEIN